MKPIKFLFAAALVLNTSWNASAVPTLFEGWINIDGTLTSGAPAGIDSGTGLGTATFTILGAGPHWFGAFFDHEIDATTYTMETGSANGTLGDGQSWEIDEPGYFNGDIFGNFSAGTLDNGIGTSIYGNTAFPDDVSWALGWGFLGPALVTVTISETAPVSGFFLRQHSADGAGPDLFFYGSVTAAGNPPGDGVPDAGATLLLMTLGLAGLAGFRAQLRRE